MNKLHRLLFLLSVLLISCTTSLYKTGNGVGSAEQNPEITLNELSEHIKYLSSDKLKGRYPGTKESKLAQAYLIDHYKQLKISQLGENSYLQTFDFINSVVPEKNNNLKVQGSNYTIAEDFIPLGFSANGELTTSAVFAGFGFAIDDSIKWNDYDDIDVNGKWVIILRGGPDDDNQSSPYRSHLPLRKKVLLAQDNNAAGVLFVSQYNDDEDELIPLKFDNSFSGASIPVIHVKQYLAKQIFNIVEEDLKTIQDSMISKLVPHSFGLKDVTIAATVELNKTTAQAANVIATIPGNDPLLKNEYIVIGGHYDHLGMGGPNSGSRTPDTLAVHNGADDNASGTVGVIEIAEKFKSIQSELKRSLIFMNFDAEERGLLGSKYFVNNPLVDLDNIVAMLNLDMIGHLKDSSLTIGGTGTSPTFEDILTQTSYNYNINLSLSPEGFGPSDHASFYAKDIPVLFFFTGTHDDYHKPTDDFPLINLDGEKDITNFVYDVALQLNQLPERPQYTEAGPKESQSSSRNFKVTLGVVPAFGGKEVGLGIDGVKKGGPADLGGILKGDIITAMDGKEITNIYDYMYRLGELKKGQSVTVTVLRCEEIISLQVNL